MLNNFIKIQKEKSKEKMRVKKVEEDEKEKFHKLNKKLLQI